jgi:hypothetical protein
MSRLPHNQYVFNNQLEIQEMVVRYSDIELIHTSSSSSVVWLGEPVASVTCVLFVGNGGVVTSVPVSAISIVNSNLYGFPSLPPGSLLYTDRKGNGIMDAVLIGASGAPVNTPPLATSASYALLAHSSITNTGSSVVTGNLGLYPGTSVTGFPPGLVVGVENVTNAAAQQAEIDATASFTYLNGLTATAITADLDGQTLTPGVYKESSGTFNLATSGNATLTLNGAGVYVFQASSTLVTGAGGVATILLTGGATASNVYWAVGSSATINSGHPGVFQGTVIASASVTDTLGGTVNGRLMALNGSVTLSAATVINVPASSSQVVGPNDELIIKYVVKESTLPGYLYGPFNI